MSIQFSEYRCKKKYKSKKKNIPLFRLLFLGALFFSAFKFGWFVKLVDAIPLFDEKEEVLVFSWDDECRNAHGTPFALKNNLAQCSWIVNDSSAYLPSPFLRYLASLRNSPEAKIHWVARQDDFDTPVLALREDSLVHSYLHVMNKDSSFVWIEDDVNCTGNCVPCAFPGPCPVYPIIGSAIFISDNFDFEGQDALLSADVFSGIGESPIHPILDGVVLDVGKDSLGYFVELNHGDNLVSRMAGMISVDEKRLAVGDSVKISQSVGRMAPHDSAMFYLTIRKNGQFLRWRDFYGETHPLENAEIAKFKKEIGF